MQALLGQRLSADINLSAQILILAGLWVGFYFARRKQISRHAAIQTAMVVVNVFFILFVMATSFYIYVIAGGSTTGPVALLMILHGLLGLTAELTGIYLLLRMATQVIPPRLRVRNFRLVMRALLGLWTVVTVLGCGIYYLRYLAPAPQIGASSATPLLQATEDIQLHAEELSAAVQRGNLTTAKRHAEHLVNLIEGKQGADYGDVDQDGFVEDPGDGTGALTYLERLRAQAGDPAGQGSLAVADQIRSAMQQVLVDAKQVIHAGNLQDAGAAAGDALALANRLKDGPEGSVAQFVGLLGMSALQAPAGGQNGTAAANSVIVNMENFTFVPARISVHKGTTAIFVNQDHAKHTVTSDTGKFDSGDMVPGQSFSHTFNEAGVFPYFCVFHGDRGGVGMAGVVEVVP